MEITHLVVSVCPSICLLVSTLAAEPVIGGSLGGQSRTMVIMVIRADKLKNTFRYFYEF